MTTPALYDLMGGYFHQDWDTYGTEDEVVDQFMNDQHTLRQQLVPEIERVLATMSSEEELSRLVTELGCEYRPHPRYGSHRAWLEAIAVRARSHPSNPSSGPFGSESRQGQ